MSETSLLPYLLLSGFLFVCGVMCFIVKRNAIGLLLGVELILNAANINFVMAARYVPSLKLEGQVFTVLVMILAAAEAAVALAIFLNYYNHVNTVNVDDANQLQG